jgi:hypothetical protein
VLLVAAVFIGFVTVFLVIATGVGNAPLRERVTGVGFAVRVEKAGLTQRALRTASAAAIGVGLGAVLCFVGALRIERAMA